MMVSRLGLAFKVRLKDSVMLSNEGFNSLSRSVLGFKAGFEKSN